jgi:iron complex transport system substrate-binding protein
MRYCLPLLLLRFTVTLSCSLLFSCNEQHSTADVNAKNERTTPPQPTINYPVSYAKGFSITETTGLKHIQVFSPWKGRSDTLHYYLGKEAPDELTNATFISTPIRSVVCLSTTHVAFMSALGLADRLSGISSSEWINDTAVQRRIASGAIKDVGRDQHLNYELLVALNPDVVFAFGVNAASMQYLKKLENLGIQAVVVSEYMENHPLGKAEWLLFFSAFFDMEEEATKRFQETALTYEKTAKLAANVVNRPRVFTGLPWKGDWFVPGGKSFQSVLFKDAGANYLWSADPATSGTVVDIEVVFERALDAEYWFNVNDLGRLEEIKAADKRYVHFKAFKENNVYNNNRRKNANNGNDYWESGVVNPDLVLKDLVEIFHPGTQGQHSLFYYQQLK